MSDAVDLALARMGQTSLDLLQYHIWKYEDATYLYVDTRCTAKDRTNLYHLSLLQESGRIKHLGLTNTDLPHLKLVKSSGFTIATNQVSISLLDRRVQRGGMGAWCAENGVGLLGYGTLLGGFVSKKWIGAKAPGEAQLGNWSLSKYKRFIDVAGRYFPSLSTPFAC